MADAGGGGGGGGFGSVPPPPIRPDAFLRLKFLHRQNRVSFFNWLIFNVGRALHLPLNLIPGIFNYVIGFGYPFMISSPLLAKQYFPRQQIFLGSPLQVNQKAYAKQAKKCRSVIKILVTPSACSQFLGFRSHDGEHFTTMHTTPFLLLFSFWLGHATSSPGCFSMALEASPN